MKNHLKHLVCEAKLSYVKQLIVEAKNNPRLSGGLWSGINNVMGRYRRKNSAMDVSLLQSHLMTILDLQRLLIITSRLLHSILWILMLLMSPPSDFVLLISPESLFF